MQLNQDLADLERHAYITGDLTTAELAARVLDAEEEIATATDALEEELAEEKAARQEAEEAVLELQRAVRERLEAVDAVLSECKRISKREELEAALQAVYNEVAN